MSDLIYNEGMSVPCQQGLCEDCPENEAPYEGDGYCSCTHHIPDRVADDDEADLMARAFYDRWSCA